MLNLKRKNKEHKIIIIRTLKGNTSSCYSFATTGRNVAIPSACQKIVSFDKVADHIELTWNMGGDVLIFLYMKHPNGFEVTETVVIDKEFITAIEIETDFDDLRKKDIIITG